MVELLAQVAKCSVTRECQLCLILQRAMISKMSLRERVAFEVGTGTSQVGGSSPLEFGIFITSAQDVSCWMLKAEEAL